MRIDAPWAARPEAEKIVIPSSFTRARELVNAALVVCECERLPTHSLLAAVTAELVPRLVAQYGPEGASLILGTLAHTVLSENSSRTPQ